MTKLYDISCTVGEDGRLPLNYGERVRDALRLLKGRMIHLVIQEPKKYSTNPQRNYYFAAIVTPIQEYFAGHGKWYDKDVLHDHMMKEIGELWNEEPNPFTEKVEKTRRSYNSLTTKEAEEYHLKCIAWAAQHDIQINEPEPVKP